MGNKSKVYIGLAVSFLAFFTLQNQFKAYGATSAVDEFTVTVPASCSLSSNVTSAHSAEVETGTYNDSIGETTINAVCNDAEGFSIYTVGYSGDEYGNNTMKPSVVAVSNAIATGTATSGDTSNWAMKLTSTSENFAINNGFNAFHTVPTEYTLAASYPSNTTTVTGVQLKTTYSAFIASAQPADSYTGKVKYVIVHPSNADAPITTISNLTYLQDFYSLSAEQYATVKASMADSTSYTLIDNRDDQTYTIAKMKDSRIWMADNLNLGATPLSRDITSENTNTGKTVSAATFNSWKKTTGSLTHYDGVYVSSEGIDYATMTKYGTIYNYFATTAGTFYGTDVRLDAAHDICPAGWRLPTGNMHDGPTGEVQALYDSGYGESYSMHMSIANGGAAFALSGSFGSGNPVGLDSTSQYWTMTSVGSASVMSTPTGSDSNFNLATGTDRYRGSTIKCIAKEPITITLSLGTGVSSIQIDDKTITSSGSISVEQGKTLKIAVNLDPSHGMGSWSTTAGTIESPTSRYTTFTPSSLISNLSISATEITPTPIQNLSSANCTSNISYVYDNRDNQTYAIKRLDDGNCWMLDNLNLGETALTTDLTSANTNLSSTITASTFNTWHKPTNSWIESTSAGAFFTPEEYDYEAGSKYGSLYNFYAASAGTITGNSSDVNSTYDICPAGWRLPTGGEAGEFQALYNNESYNSFTKMHAPAEKNGASFSTPGFFTSTYFQDKPYRGNYWTSTSYSVSMMTMYIYIDGAYAPGVYPSGYYARSSGQSIRCVMKKPKHTLTVTYTSGISEITVNGSAVANGGTITLEGEARYTINATLAPGYEFSNWSVTSGNINTLNSSSAIYTMSTNDANLTASASYVSTEIQNLPSSSCTSTATKVRDNRDNHLYVIQRLADGKCWMIDNLDLGRSTLATDLTSSNTNLSTTIVASTFNSWKTTNGSYTNTYTNGVFVPQSGNDPTSLTAYGTLYNYYAASAGTITGDSNSDNASYDICPAGWRLPTGGSGGDFQTLYSNNAYNTSGKLRASISSGGAAFNLAGYYYYNYISGTDSYSGFWSSTANNTAKMYDFWISNNPEPLDSTDRKYGLSIRCILKT